MKKFIALFLVVATGLFTGFTLMYQPIQHDGTLTGIGNVDSPLGVVGNYYDEYVAVIAQSGTATPTATVLETLADGAVTLGRTDVGRYTFTLTDAFTTDKTFIVVTNGDVADFDIDNIEAGWVDDDTILVRCFSTGSFVDLDGMKLYISIRVYP